MIAVNSARLASVRQISIVQVAAFAYPVGHEIEQPERKNVPRDAADHVAVAGVKSHPVVKAYLRSECAPHIPPERFTYIAAGIDKTRNASVRTAGDTAARFDRPQARI